jgi:hypothetical protein
LYLLCCDAQDCAELARSLAWVPLHIRLDIDEKYCSHCAVQQQHTDTAALLRARPGGFDEDVDALLQDQLPQVAVATTAATAAAITARETTPTAAAAVADSQTTEELEDWLDSVLQ